jgi:hypothetical protein
LRQQKPHDYRVGRYFSLCFYIIRLDFYFQYAFGTGNVILSFQYMFKKLNQHISFLKENNSNRSSIPIFKTFLKVENSVYIVPCSLAWIRKDLAWCFLWKNQLPKQFFSSHEALVR